MEPLTTLDVHGRPVVLRRARPPDVPAILDLMADDDLGRSRETVTDLGPYRAAFDVIDADPAQLLVVATLDARAVATLQLTFIPGLSRRGSLRCQVEAVRVASDLRGSGLGGAMMRWVIDEARSRSCSLVQLTSHLSRTDAHRFYARLGFEPSHLGLKLTL